MKNFTLIGYTQSKKPKIVLSTTFHDRQIMWKEGYSVDAIPIEQALEIAILFGVQPSATASPIIKIAPNDTVVLN